MPSSCIGIVVVLTTVSFAIVGVVEVVGAVGAVGAVFLQATTASMSNARNNLFI
jgi:hypothetical protein